MALYSLCENYCRSSSCCAVASQKSHTGRSTMSVQCAIQQVLYCSLRGLSFSRVA